MHIRSQRGVSLVEVLVAMVILAVGLLGLVGLQGRLHVLQMESYQRAQALILLHDMGSRIMLNRNNADDYVTGSPLGEGADCTLILGATRAIEDSRDWCNAIQGSAETIGADDTRVGAMLGGRGLRRIARQWRVPGHCGLAGSWPCVGAPRQRGVRSRRL